MRILFTVIILALVVNCKSSDHNVTAKNTEQMNQGIEGKVLWLEGNFMPGPGMNKEGEPVVRQLYIYPIINKRELTRSGDFYEIPDKEPVKVIESNEDGTFKVNLKPGSYSLFSKEEGGIYASIQDGKGNINPIEVTEGEFTEVTFRIDYKAVY